MDRGGTAASDQEVRGSTQTLKKDFVVGEVLRETPLTNGKPMNARSFSSRCKRAILNPQHATPRVAEMLFASFLAGRFGVRRPSKVRSFTTFQRSTLLRFGFFGRRTPGAVLPQFFARFLSSFVLAQSYKQIGMPTGKMLLRSKTFQIFQSVVRLIFVNVMDVFARVKVFHPTHRYNAVEQVFTAYRQISVRVFGRRVRTVLSENFPATRNGVIVVENPVFNAVNFKANHVVSPMMANKILYSTT